MRYLPAHLIPRPRHCRRLEQRGTRSPDAYQASESYALASEPRGPSGGATVTTTRPASAGPCRPSQYSTSVRYRPMLPPANPTMDGRVGPRSRPRRGRPSHTPDELLADLGRSHPIRVRPVTPRLQLSRTRSRPDQTPTRRRRYRVAIRRAGGDRWANARRSIMVHSRFEAYGAQTIHLACRRCPCCAPRSARHPRRIGGTTGCDRRKRRHPLEPTRDDDARRDPGAERRCATGIPDQRGDGAGRRVRRRERDRAEAASAISAQQARRCEGVDRRCRRNGGVRRARSARLHRTRAGSIPWSRGAPEHALDRVRSLARSDRRQRVQAAGRRDRACGRRGHA